MPTTNIKEILKRQSCIEKQIKSILKNYTNSADNTNESAIELRLQEVSKLWGSFMENHQLIHENDEDEADEYINSTIYEETEDLYIQLSSTMQSRLKEYTSQTSSQILETTISHPRRSDIKLPPISIPKFDGTYKSWRSFHDLFNSLIHNNTKLSEVEKLHYLKSCVSGEAEALIRQYDLTNENYKHA